MDIDAIKSRLNQLQNTTSTNFWKPQPGKSQVRIVPYSHNKENPFSELFFHYSLVPNKTVLSPLSFVVHLLIPSIYERYLLLLFHHFVFSYQFARTGISPRCSNRLRSLTGNGEYGDPHRGHAKTA